jgi:hypothetical protein
MQCAFWQSRSKTWRLPAAFALFVLGGGLAVDTYRAWALSDSWKECQTHFAVLYAANLQDSSGMTSAPAEQAIRSWEKQVHKKYGAAYANFNAAKGRHSGVEECYPDLDGLPKQCGYASGRPCRGLLNKTGSGYAE